MIKFLHVKSYKIIFDVVTKHKTFDPAIVSQSTIKPKPATLNTYFVTLYMYVYVFTLTVYHRERRQRSCLDNFMGR